MACQRARPVPFVSIGESTPAAQYPMSYCTFIAIYRTINVHGPDFAGGTLVSPGGVATWILESLSAGADRVRARGAGRRFHGRRAGLEPAGGRPGTAADQRMAHRGAPE